MKHISEIIDKILIEWSYMLPDGMPDLKNPYHMVKLREALKKVNFSEDDFRGSKCNRLKQLELLRRQNILSAELKWL